jgi:hypothetical protein
VGSHGGPVGWWDPIVRGLESVRIDELAVGEGCRAVRFDANTSWLAIRHACLFRVGTGRPGSVRFKYDP